MVAAGISYWCAAAAPAGQRSEPTVACANLVYSGTRTAVCFSDRFLTRLAAETTIRVAPRFVKVRLDDAAALSSHPFAIMSGEGAFALSDRERANLRRFLTRGGFLVASAGCSNPDWARSFRSELGRMLPGKALQRIPSDHPLFRTVYLIRSLDTAQRRGRAPAVLEGLSMEGRLVLVFSADGLNDTRNARNCCCCGGDEIVNAEFVNVNLMAYALLH
mgnify:CR=1 FL=1